MKSRGWPQLSELACYVDFDNEDDEEFIELLEEVIGKLVVMRPELEEQGDALLKAMGFQDVVVADLKNRSSIKHNNVP
jgi:hypothetical protein